MNQLKHQSLHLKYTTMEWISVRDRLPNDGDLVIIYAGNYNQKQKTDIATFEKGISLEERERMKNGEMPFEMIGGIHYNGSTGNAISTKPERWKVYSSPDEYGNNTKPYSWHSAPMRYFGQDVTHWMPIPAPPTNPPPTDNNKLSREHAAEVHNR